MVKTLSPRQYWAFMVKNLPLAMDTADTAQSLMAAPNFVARADILAPYLKRVAPAADELSDLITGNVQVRTSPERLKRQLLEALADHSAQTTKVRVMRDGKWLEAGRKFFMQFVMPLLVSQLQEQLLGNRATPATDA